MPRVNMYRYFNQTVKPGVRPYKRSHDKLTKPQAELIARNVRRDEGARARVVKEADGYVVFILRKR